MKLALAVLIWTFAGEVALAGDMTAQFTSGPIVEDLVCPATASHPTPRSSQAPEAAPSVSELGALANVVIREQPRIGYPQIGGFALTPGADGHSRRIGFWGDSHIASGPFVDTLYQVLRDHGLRVAPGFLPPTMGRSNVRLSALHAYCIGDAWSSESAYNSRDTYQGGPALFNRMVTGGPQSYLWMDLRDASLRSNVRRIGILYRAKQGGSLELSVNDGPTQQIALPASFLSDVIYLEGDADISTVRLTVSEGQFVLHGFSLEYDEAPQVELDTFGLPSSTARGWANLDPSYVRHSLRGAGYDAIVLEYGTNEGNESPFDRVKYEAGLSTALGNLRRVFPDASCVLMGPPDRGVTRRRTLGGLLFYSHIHEEIASSQATVGARFGCALWNWQSLMGGPGGSYGWAHASPRLMNPADLIHLDASGYELTARELARSLGWGDSVPPHR